MGRGRQLEQTPGLIDPDIADDVGRMGAGVGVRSGAVGADRRRNAQIVDGSAIPDGRIVQTDRGRHAVAELGGVLDVVEAGVGIVAAEQARVDVARETVPGGRISRRGLTEGEAGELDEKIFDRDITAASAGELRRVEESGARHQRRRVPRAVVEVVELEVTLAEGAYHAVLGRGAGINRQCHTGTGDEIIGIAVLLTEIAVPGRRAVVPAVERGVDAQITTQPDAGVGARDVEETRAIQGANPHIFDCLGLDRKVSRLCPAQGHQARCRAEDECSRRNHLSLLSRDSCSCMWNR